MMQKMSLNQATGIGDGKLGKRIKKKTKEIKRKVKMKLGNLGDDIRRGIRDLKSKDYSKKDDRQERREMRRANRGGASEGTIKGISGSENQSEQAESKGKYFQERKSGERRFGKYANPVLYKAETVVRNIGDAIGQSRMTRKENKGRKRAMQDAAGPTKRNKDVMVCKEGQCQAR